MYVFSPFPSSLPYLKNEITLFSTYLLGSEFEGECLCIYFFKVGIKSFKLASRNKNKGFGDKKNARKNVNHELWFNNCNKKQAGEKWDLRLKWILYDFYYSLSKWYLILRFYFVYAESIFMRIYIFLKYNMRNKVRLTEPDIKINRETKEPLSQFITKFWL